MNRALIVTGLAVSLASGALAQGLPGKPKLPLAERPWSERVKSMLELGYLGPNSKTWSGEEDGREYLGASLDTTRGSETRISLQRWGHELRLASYREPPTPRLIELRSGFTLEVGGPGVERGGGVNGSLLRVLRNVGWLGPKAVGFWDFHGLALSYPGHDYALVIQREALEPARARWRAERKGKPLALLGSGPRILDRMLAWEQWELEQGAGAVPFTLQATGIAPTRWRFHARDVGEFRVYLLSPDLPQLATFLASVCRWGVPAKDLPSPAPAAPVQPTPPDTGGLTAALVPTTEGWTPGRTDRGLEATRDASRRLLVGGDVYDPGVHGALTAFPSHPNYGRARNGWPLFRRGGGLRVLSPWGTQHDYEPGRHGPVVAEAPLPAHLGYAERDGRRTYLVRQAGQIKALWEEVPGSYDPAKHGPIVQQPPSDAGLVPTVWGYQVAEHEGQRYVLRAELPPATYEVDLHGALAQD